jgi:acetyl esterase/lipase
VTQSQTQPGTNLMERQQQIFASLRSEIPPSRPRQDYPGVTSYYDIPYAVVPGFRPLCLDLHVPDGEGPFPVLLWAHGGGWSGGSRAAGHPQRMVSRGYAVAATQYRLSGEAKFPAQLFDLKGAVRWLRANAARFQLDPQNIAGWGASAGAHLVALLALTAGNPNFEGDVGGNLEQSSALQAVIDYFGPADFFPMEAAMAHRPGGSPVTNLLGYPIAERPDEARTAMPLTHVRRDAPPFLLLHGDIDPLVPHEQSRLLHDALRQAGADATLVTLPGAFHEDPAFWSDDILAQIQTFLERTLRRAGEPARR